MAVWNPKIECAKRSEIEAIQLERLKWSVQHAYDHVPMYHDKMVKAGVKPSDIRTLRDIAKIPLTTKTELREQYPFKLLAVPMREVVRIHASSGTTGQPITAGYTRRDLDTWAECIARIATAGGATADDIAQVSFGYTLFTGAFGLHGGLEKIGCAIIPISSGNTERQINIMRDFGSTVLIATPSYALYMAEVAERMDALKDIRLRVGLFGAEASTEEMRAELERRYGILATENYGLTEVMGPGVSGECEYKCGMHINEDCFLAEIIDPDTDWVGTGIFAWPLPQSFTITSPFGYRQDPFTGEWSYHNGTDIAAPQGTPILAAADGTVTIANGTDPWGGSYGYYIKLDHGEGIETLYAHCSAIAVTAGQQVQQGEVIGYVGNTGNSTGNHLHFEMWENGQQRDVMNCFAIQNTTCYHTKSREK